MFLKWSASVFVFLLACGQAEAQSRSAEGSPFALHAGVGYAEVPDTDFEVVQALSGQEGISRALVTLGLVTNLAEQGVQPVPDQVFRGTGDRILYSGVQQERKWGLFVAASFGVLQ